MKRNILIVIVIFLINCAGAGIAEWRVVSEMPVPVSGAVAFKHDSLIYIFGGHNSSDFVTPTLIQIYNPLLNSWQIDTIGTLENSRYGGTGGIWQNTAYFFGGHTGNNRTNMDVWGPNGDAGISLLNHNDNFNRYFASSQIYNGKIYGFGGYSINTISNDRPHLPYIFIYDINNRTVEREINSDYTNELPYYQMTVRIRHRIFILGGTYNGVLNTIHYYNTLTDTLRNFGRRMKTARYGGTAHALGDSAIILIGGWNGRDRVLSETEIINLKYQETFNVPNIANLSYARAEHVSVKFGDDLYVFGGRNTSINDDVSAVEKFSDYETITAIENKAANPSAFELANNYPNPFNPSTVISYQLSISSDIVLKVFDISGRLITTLVNDHQVAGKHKVTFNASSLASGIYFYTLKSGEQSQTKRMILIR